MLQVFALENCKGCSECNRRLSLEKVEDCFPVWSGNVLSKGLTGNTTCKARAKNGVIKLC